MSLSPPEFTEPRRAGRGCHLQAALFLVLTLLLARARATAAPSPGDVLWSYDTPTPTLTLGPGFAPDGTAYALDQPAQALPRLSALSTNGTVQWTTTLPARRLDLTAGINPAVTVAPNGDLLAVVGMTVHRVSSNGELRWSQAFAQRPQPGVAIAPDGSVYLLLQPDAAYPLTQAPAQLACLAADGSLRWQTAADSTVLMLASDGSAIALGTASTRFWPDGSTANPEPIMSYNPSGFVGLDDRLCLQQTGGSLYDRFAGVVDLTGHALWYNFDLAYVGPRGVQLPDRTLCLPTSVGTLLALDSGGTQTWSTNISTRPCLGLCAATNGLLYATFDNGDVGSLDGGGHLRWLSSTGRGDLSGSPILLNDGSLLLCPGRRGITVLAGDGVPGVADASGSSRGGISANNSRQRPLPIPTLPPPQFQASHGVTASYVAVTWSNAPSAQQYEVWRGSTPDLATAHRVADFVAGTLLYEDLDTLPGVTNYYWCRALNTTGVGPFAGPDAGSRRAGLNGTFSWRRIAGAGAPMMATISDSGTVALLTTAGPLQIVDAAGNPAGQDFPLPPDAAYGHFSFQCQSSDGRILLGVQEATSTPDGFMRGRLICLNPTGHFLWEHRFRSPLTLPPAISPSGITYLPLSPDPGSAPDETDGLLAISPSGEFLWRWSPPGSLSTAPAVWDDGTVWVASTEPAFYRISPSGTMIRRVPLPGPVRGRPSPSPAGHWWLAGATGFQVVPTDFTVGHTVSAPATVADEALASNDGQMVFGVADAATYKGSPDGAHWGVMLPTTGFPWAITSSNTCAVASASGIDEVSLSPSLRRRLTTAGHRITPVTVGPTGLAVFGTLEGAWYAAMLTAPLGGSVWPHVGHDSRFSGATQVPFGRPGAPLSMTASTNAFRGSVILRWGSPTNAEFYALFRRGPGDPSDGVKVIDQLVGDTTYTDAPPIVGATYDYWAVAYNHTGAGPASKIVSFKVPVPRPGDLLVGSSIAGAAIGPVALGFDDSVYAALQVTNTAGATTVGWGLAAFSPNLSLRWFHPTAAPPAFGPAVAPTGTILCTQAGGLLEALSPDGTVLWQVSLGGDILAPPAIDPDGRIYVCHSLVSVVTYGPCKVEAFAPSGARLWETVVPDSTGSAQLLLTGDGRLVVEGGSSSTPWMRTYETNGAPFAPPTPSAAYLSLLAITGKGNAVTHDGTNLRVIRPDTSLAWQRNAQTDLPRRDAIVGPGDILYPLGLFGTVSRMTSESQSIIATLPSTPGPMVLDRDGTLYGGSADGVLRAFTTNGVSQWSVRLDGDLSTHSPALGSNGILYAVAPNGQLYAVYSGSTLAPAPWACEGANAQRSYLGHASTLPLMAPVLSASYGQFADGVHLHWAPVDGAWEYAVTRSESPDPLGAVTVAANLPAGDLVDTHVEEDLEYWYWVVARAGDRIEVAPAPVLGLRRSPVRGDTLLLGPTSSPGLSIALTPEGEPRILGGDRLMTYSRHLDPTAQVSLTFPVIPPLVITPAGALCYRSGDMLLRTNQIVVLSQEGQLAWTWTASPSSTLISEPAVGTDGTLYVSQSSGKVAAIGSGGALRWEVDCQQPLTLAPSVSADGVVVIVGALGDAFAISERGKLLWQHKGLNALLSPTFSTEGNVLLANSSSDLSLSGYRSLSLVALDVGTGDELWRSPTIPFTGGAMPPLIGTGNKIWFEASGSIMQTNRLILSEGYSPSGTLTPKLAQATVSLGTGIAVMADGLEVLRIPLPHHTLQVSDDQGIAAFTASVNGLSDPSSILLDNDGWLLALLAPGEFLLEEVFVGSPAASTCWPMWRADSQRSGRASRRVTPKVGPVEYFNGSRVIPISVDVALGLGTPASMELLVDGVVLPSDFPTPTGALTRWPAEKVGLHQLTVQLTYPDGNSTTDGPWSFGLPMPPLTVTTVAEGLRISVDSSLGVSYQLESSPDLLTWAPVSAPVPGNGGTIDWPLVSASGALPGTTFYRLMVNP